MTEHQEIYAVQEAEAVLRRDLVFRDPSLRHGFTQVPNLILRDSSLSANAKVLYMLLLSYAWHNNECFPGHILLVEHMGCVERTLRSTFHELRDRKLITWERRGLGKTNIYTIERLDGGYLPRQYVDRGHNGN